VYNLKIKTKERKEGCSSDEKSESGHHQTSPGGGELTKPVKSPTAQGGNQRASGFLAKNRDDG